ncbi:MAG: FG-GAP-like repeat-containing protein [Hyphomicrobiaceae bacterium]
MLSISQTITFPVGLSPSLTDTNGDGSLELFGTLNNGSGVLTAQTLPGGFLVPGRVNRDNRVADLDNDGQLDVIGNVYTVTDPATSHIFITYSYGTTPTELLPDGVEHSGFGETIVVADFNNDGRLDFFVPRYTHAGTSPGNLLFINQGGRMFEEVGLAWGVGLPNQPLPLRVEGAQALDFNNDGWLDLFVASTVFINQGGTGFVEQNLGQPEAFDEGVKFADFNNDGLLDYVWQDSEAGPMIQLATGTGLDGPQISLATYSTDVFTAAYGLNVFDIDGNGFEDVIVPSNDGPGVFYNQDGTTFTWAPLSTTPASVDLIAAGDLDGDGMAEIITRRGVYNMDIWHNDWTTTRDLLSVEVLGATGRQDQQGRAIKVQSGGDPSTYMKLVESGSGYMAQNPYSQPFYLLPGQTYTVSVSYASGPMAATVRGDGIKMVFREQGGVVGTGGGGSDLIGGTAYNDVLDGLAGADTLQGGLGNDTYVVRDAGDVVYEGANSGFDTVNAVIDYTLPDNVERLFFMFSGNYKGTGNALGNILIGNTGNNVLDGWTGIDTMQGGLGNDTYVVRETGDVVVEAANSGFDTVNAVADYTLPDNVERLFFMFSGNYKGLETHSTTSSSAIRVPMFRRLVRYRHDAGGLGNDTYVVREWRCCRRSCQQRLRHGQCGCGLYASGQRGAPVLYVFRELQGDRKRAGQHPHR